MKEILGEFAPHVTIVLIIWLWTAFEPLQDFLTDVFDRVLADRWYFHTLYELLTCWKCLTLWVSLAYFGFKLDVLVLAFTVHILQLFESKLNAPK